MFIHYRAKPLSMAAKIKKSSTSTSADAKPRVTKYGHVLDYLYAEIHSGRIAPGALMPTECELSESLGMSRNTVRHALDKLVQEGVIQRFPGRGTFVTTHQQRQSRQQLELFALISPQLREGAYPSLVHGFEQAGSAQRYQVAISNSANDVSRQGDLVLQMIDRSVGGVALVPVTSAATPAYQIRQLQKHQIPVVFCHRSVEGVSAPCVTYSGYEVGRLAGRVLHENGHRRIGFLFTRRYWMVSEYERGLQNAFSDGGPTSTSIVPLEYGTEPCAQPGNRSSVEAIRRMLCEVIARPDRPTAIFTGNTVDAEQVYLQADALGMKVPRDLSIICFGGSWRDHGLAERICCIAVDEHELGAKAAELLHEMRLGKRAIENDERIEFPLRMLSGETIGPAPAD